MTILEDAIKALEKAGKTNIKGKQYSQVSTRVEVFRRHFGHEYSIETDLLHADDRAVTVKAIIRSLETGHVITTGLAEERRSTTGVNSTSALENCETSAIGRALAAFGLHGGEYASSNEVESAIDNQAKKAQSKQAPPKEAPPTKSKMLDAIGKADTMDKLNHIWGHTQFKADFSTLSEDDQAEVKSAFSERQDQLNPAGAP